RRLGKLSDSVDVEFDTINRVVNYRVRQQRDLGVIFRYQKNIREITKTTVFPRATRLMPIGRGGLTIASVNDGSDYIEDFSWYESLGMNKQEARERYTKTMIWKDERYIYAGNLMREGQRKLSQLAHPQIAYDVELSYLDVDLQVGDYAYVIDEELGIKVRVEVVKLNEYKDPTKNKVELNYLVPALHDDAGGSEVGQVSGDSPVDIAYTRLNNDVVIEAGRYTEALHIALTTYAPTNLQLGIYMVRESSMDSTLDGYISMGGNKVGMPIRHKLNSGWNTISLMMVLTQIQEGADMISLYLSVDQGTFTLSRDESELALIGRNILGGASARLPRANVVDTVEFVDAIDVSDASSISLQTPTSRVITEDVVFQLPDLTDRGGLVVLGAANREDFADMSRYTDYTYVPAQENVDDFIDNLYSAYSLFYVVALGDSIYVVTTIGKWIDFDTINNTVRSDGEVFALGYEEGMEQVRNWGRFIDFSDRQLSLEVI